ncbi:MAG: type II secretion system secretin GspD [Gammaproteobacteria bacterium]
MKKINKFQTASCLVLTSLALAGCESLGPEQRAKLPIYESPGTDQEEQKVVFEQLDNRPIDESQTRLQAEIYPGGGLPVSDLAPHAVPEKSKGPGAYSLNFDEADLGEVAKVIISDILEQNYVLSPKVAGSVTLQTTQPLTREQLLPTLEMLLRMNNAALVKAGGVYHIEPANQALYSSAVSVGRFRGALPAGYQVSVIPVRNVGVDDIGEILKPLIGETTLLHTDASRNLLLAGGSAAELERVKDIVGLFDVDVLRGRSFALFPLAQVDPETLIEELNTIFANKSPEGDSGFFRFIPIERMNAILAITHQARYLTDIENWIARLDRAKTSAGGGVNVYKVQNVEAVALAATLTDIFGGVGGQPRRPPSVAPGRKTVEITNKQTPEATQTAQRSAQNRPNAGESTGIANIKDVRFIADEINNTLVIVSTAQEYGVIRKVIEQLDVMPLQVLIDATIVDVTLTDNLQYGIEWFLQHENGGTNIITSGAERTGLDLTSLAAGVATGGLGYSFVSNSGDIRAVLRAEALKKNINVISSPSLMVLNNQEASIQVGNEISLRTSQNTQLGGNANNLVQTNPLQQRKTGVKLKVKPRVNAGGLVIMEITQSVEDPGTTSSTESGNPDILTREITSSVAVQTGETLVLGGLIKENNTKDKTGIPFLHELPLIGPLFGNTTLNKDKTELVVLITPRVVTGKFDARAVSNEFKRKLTGIYQEMPDQAGSQSVN